MIETDYLIIGAGACGMAFADALIAYSDADVVLVDRRHRPGGHWNDDYSFVRLHQPSAYYGVDSRSLGFDRIDQTGPNAGFYERASGAEVCDYYGRVMDEVLLPSDRVRFFGSHDYLGEASGEHHITSLLTGRTENVRVRAKVVDATYIATTIPSKHKPSFSIDPGARVIPPNDLVDLAEPASGFTVLGAGKTSMDTCCWLIDQGVDPGSIRWVRPRDAFTIDRTWMQPLSLVGSMIEWLALQNEAAADARDVPELIARLEDTHVFERLDPSVEPDVYRGATLSRLERTKLRSIENVVRMGRIIHVGRERIELQNGSTSTGPGHVYVDCTAAGIGTPAARPIFEPERITIQRVQAGIDPFNAALIGRVEATGRDYEAKNRLCPPNEAFGEVNNYPRGLLVTLRARVAWRADPEIREWVGKTRLTALRDIAVHMNDAAKASAKRMSQSTVPAIENLVRILSPN